MQATGLFPDFWPRFLYSTAHGMLGVLFRGWMHLQQGFGLGLGLALQTGPGCELGIGLTHNGVGRFDGPLLFSDFFRLLLG